MSHDATIDPPTAITTDGAELVELDREECLRLIAGNHFGRVGLTGAAEVPIIRPLNYVFDAPSQCVAFRTVPGSKLSALVRRRKAAFEIDGIDPGFRSGWSVIIVGVTEEVTNAADLRRLDELGLDVWAPGDRPHWFRIRAWAVSGRRISRTP
jgi:uncharacterized protein